MKILVLTSRFPYPIEKGDKLRAYHQIRVLAARHQIVLIALAEHPPTAESLEALAAFCEEIHVLPLSRWQAWGRLLKGFFRGWPLQCGYFYTDRLRKKIHRLVRAHQPDHVYCQLIRMAPYATALDLPRTLDYMDAFSIGMQRRADHMRMPFKWVFQREARFARAFERKMFDHFDHHSIISEQDRSYLDLPHPENVRVIPNGVDTQFFSPDGSSGTFEVVFVGNMSYFPNVVAARFLVRKIMPRIWARRPQARVLLAGANPTMEVRTMASPQVVVSGWLDDVRDAYRQAQVFVAPLFSGSGQQNKILEAMAMALPVVTTPMVNRAIGATAGQSVLLAESGEHFAHLILDLLRKAQLRTLLGTNARAFVEAHFSWEAAVAPLESLFTLTADTASSPRRQPPAQK